jgi:FtsZ-binding cell division protein ZapB
MEERAKKADTLEGQVEGLRKDVEDLRKERDELERIGEEKEEDRRKEVEELKEKADELEKGLSRAREREGGLEAEVGRLRSVRIPWQCEEVSS